MFANLIKWSQSHYSDLPWRSNRSMYTTFVSEIMLQQTTVSTVLNHFPRFVKKYPSLKILAVATEEEIQVDWKGLGYYRRARNLLNAVNEILEKYDGIIPANYEQLTSIKGIGQYTANALISIGADLPALAVDANLERVLARVYGLESEKGPKLQKEIADKFKLKEICNEIGEHSSREFNEALMDLGRRVCQSRRAACDICPLREACNAYKTKRVDSLPRISQTIKKQKYYELVLLRVLCLKDDKILAYKKNSKQWLSGQLEVPTFVMFSEDEDIKQYPKFKGGEHLSFLPEFKTSITKYRIINKVIYMNSDELSLLGLNEKDYNWEILSAKTNLSTSSFKALKL